MKCELEGCDNDARRRVWGWYCSNRHEQTEFQNMIRAMKAVRNDEEIPEPRTAADAERAALWTPAKMEKRIRDLRWRGQS